MMFWMTLFLLIINAKLSTTRIQCQEFHVHVREYQSISERNNCKQDDFDVFPMLRLGGYDQECSVPILYFYCVCKNVYRWEWDLKTIIASNFLGVHLKNKQESLKKLYINNSFVDELEVNAFNRLGNLTDLYLQNNNIAAIEKGVFNLLKNLTILDLSNNKVAIIEKNSFHGLTNLEKLNISHNKIQIIFSDIFDKNLNTMRILDLSHNLISTIELTLAIPEVISFQLDLSFNKIKSFNFSQLYLNTLDLNSNNLGSLNDLVNPIKEFGLSISKIETLDISQNSITKLEPSVFNKMLNLSYLYLKNNALTELHIGIFKNLKNLKILSLSGNHLQQFEFGTFSGLSELLELDISNNSLSSVDYKAFHILSSLRKLNIANNELTTFNPNDILNHCDNIKELILNDNPWNCESLLNFTVTFKKRHVHIIEGSNTNTKNHLGHACHEVPKENLYTNDVMKEIENLRGYFIAFMTILILILLIALFLPVIKRLFINSLNRKPTNFALVQPIRHESVNEYYN